MAKLLIFLIFVTILAIASGRSSDGLLLNPEFLKSAIEIRVGNDYMDYSPYHSFLLREVAEIPVTPGSILEILESRV
ncbi:hypothetical protein SFRURICE_011778 [Spodoptera frugiperda]|uniref:SFRICE_020852 n=1 Tax=Spodoptera frugiperda TaxID=7108 RepID=A0A2H1VKG3_SPOFR|nr:hypothetical protein SFRURICE_011778 [Spodoptera frugiperda]